MGTRRVTTSQNPLAEEKMALETEASMSSLHSPERLLHRVLSVPAPWEQGRAVPCTALRGSPAARPCTRACSPGMRKGLPSPQGFSTYLRSGSSQNSPL